MALTRTVRLSFEGRFVVSSFVDFAARRAARLDIDARVLRADDGVIALDVTGQRDLIDAFEMACSLGPLDCLVLDCRSTATAVSEMETSDR
jgi:acylphosphatase